MENYLEIMQPVTDYNFNLMKMNIILENIDFQKNDCLELR